MLILASASPRRKELLSSVGVDYRVQPAAMDESRRPGEAPLSYVRRIAREKAETVQRQQEAPSDPVLAADTIVQLGNEVFGKPVDAADARRMLEALSGRAHVVSTCVHLLANGESRQVTVRSQVYFRRLSGADIARYIATGEPFDKAGSYGIQGQGMALVQRVRGSYTNVVGLPVQETLALLAAAGLAVSGLTAAP